MLCFLLKYWVGQINSKNEPKIIYFKKLYRKKTMIKSSNKKFL